MKYTVFLIVTLFSSLAGCSEENAAKIAPYLGAETINEKKADIFAKAGLRKASSCESRRKEIEKFKKCVEEAVEDVMKADALYIKDCENGNSRACRKRKELYDKWDSGKAG